MSNEISHGDKSKKLAEALLKGWKMLPETCPVCGSPLFETPGGEVVCAVCGTKVILVQSEEDVKVEKQKLVLGKIIGDLIKYLEREIYESENDLSNDRINRINSLLDAIDKASSIYKSLTHQERKHR